MGTDIVTQYSCLVFHTNQHHPAHNICILALTILQNSCFYSEGTVFLDWCLYEVQKGEVFWRVTQMQMYIFATTSFPKSIDNTFPAVTCGQLHREPFSSYNLYGKNLASKLD